LDEHRAIHRQLSPKKKAILGCEQSSVWDEPGQKSFQKLPSKAKVHSKTAKEVCANLRQKRLMFWNSTSLKIPEMNS
jgi:hypothetical protein